MRIVVPAFMAGHLVLFLPALSAQVERELSFVRLGVEDGLSHNTSNALLQDRRGFLWIATNDGLDRYDGYGFEHFRVDLSTGRSNVLRKLCEDSRGQLWVGSRNGLLRFDRATESFVGVDLGAPDSVAAGSEVRAIEEDARGRLWVAAGADVFLRQSGEDRFRRLAVVSDSERTPGEVVLGLVPFEGGAWVLSGDYALRMKALTRVGADGSVERFEHSEPRATGRGLLLDPEGELWLSAARWGSMLPPITDDFPAGIPASVAVEVIRRAPDDSIWMGTTRGLYHLPAGGSGELEHISLGESFQERYVLDLLFDRTGSLWVATLAGVLRHDAGRIPFEHLGYEPGEVGSLSGRAVSTVAGDGDVLWVGTFGGGLTRVDRLDGSTKWYRHDPGDPFSLCDDVVWASHLDEAGRLWLGTAPGVCLFDPATGRFHLLSDPLPVGSPADVRRIVAGAGGKVWVGLSTRGLYEVDPQTFRWRLLAREGANLLALERGREGVTWVGYSTGVLLRLDAQGRTTDRYELTTPDGRRMASLWIYDIHADAEGSLWLATDSGLMRFWPRERRLELAIAADQLPGSVCFSVEPDVRGSLWIGTNRGLARLEPKESGPRQVRVFGPADPVGNVEFNRAAAYRGVGGEMLFGGMNGLTIVHPERIESGRVPPPVALTRISILGRDGERALPAWGLGEVTLRSGDLALSVQFAALDYVSPSHVRYAFELEGLDPDWVDSGSRRFARYTSIPPGRYRFRVAASDPYAGWRRESAPLEVEVLPPFWETAWFRFLLVASVAGLLYLGYRLRVRRLLELERMRLRIATDLHDELGGELSSIALSASIARRQDYLREPERQRLEEIEATSQTVAGGLRDIVWYINPEHDTLVAVVRRMREAAAQILGDLEWSFEGHGTESVEAMTMVARRDLFLIFKEALTNVVRHAGATRVTIRLRCGVEGLLLEIEDDGCGFDSGAVRAGSGLSSIERRAERLEGVLEIATMAGAGTTIRLRVPLARVRRDGENSGWWRK